MKVIQKIPYTPIKIELSLLGEASQFFKELTHWYKGNSVSTEIYIALKNLLDRYK